MPERPFRFADLRRYRPAPGESLRPLPPGQRDIRGFPRFGKHVFAPLPNVPDEPDLLLRDLDGAQHRVSFERLTELPRRRVEADFHCVTTWSKRGLAWEGASFRDFFEQVVATLGGESAKRATHVVFVGHDGYRVSLPLDDALAEDTLLANTLNGEPLCLAHGAPLRFVAPAHYGYKNLKHLRRIELRAEQPKLGSLEHARARLAEEERHPWLPNWTLRLFGPLLLIPLVAWGQSRALRRGNGKVKGRGT